MFVAAMVCLVLAVWWELRVPDPVVELGLLRERNFAFASIFYFLFGFVLFGSTTMIPEILQSLYGYTATDAGLVLGPGAAVITVLAPIVAVLTQKGKVRPKWLIAFSFAVVSLSMLYYSSDSRCRQITPTMRWRAHCRASAMRSCLCPSACLLIPTCRRERTTKAPA